MGRRRRTCHLGDRDTPYVYDAAGYDPEDTTVIWRLRVALDTCGGTVDRATGVYAFTPLGPAPPATCLLAMQACDGALCRYHNATITIQAVNDAPVHMKDGTVKAYDPSPSSRSGR